LSSSVVRNLSPVVLFPGVREDGGRFRCRVVRVGLLGDTSSKVFKLFIRRHSLQTKHFFETSRFRIYLPSRSSAPSYYIIQEFSTQCPPTGICGRLHGCMSSGTWREAFTLIFSESSFRVGDHRREAISDAMARTAISHSSGFCSNSTSNSRCKNQLEWLL
jgi:hypothetical protein